MKRDVWHIERKTWLKLTLCITSFDMFSDSIVVPLLSAIFKEYPNANQFQQNVVISGSALGSIIGALVVGILMRYISKRKLAIGGSILYLIGGTGGVFTSSIGFLMITRLLTGISNGILSAVALSLIAELFNSEKERSSLLGMYNAASLLFGTVVAILAGVIALTAWRMAFLFNLVSLISLILIVSFIPETSPDRKYTYAKEEKPVTKKPFGPIVVTLTGFLLLATFFNQMYYLVDLYVAEKGIGTSVLSGVLSSAMSIIGTIACLAFGFIYMHAKRFVSLFCFLGCAFALIGLSVSNDAIMAFLMVILAGSSFAICTPYFSCLIAEQAPGNVGIFMSIFTIEMYAAAFLSPYIPFVIKSIFHTSTISGSFLFSGIILIILGFIFFYYLEKNLWYVTDFNTQKKLDN